MPSLRAKRSNPYRNMKARVDCFVASLLAMTARYTFDGKIHLRIPATHCARVVQERSAQRGRGECRVPVAPAASCAKCSKAHELVTTVAPGSPGIPARDGFTTYFALSPVIGLSCHRRLADTSAKLDAGVEASGPHDFAVRKISAFVFGATCVHRIPCPTSVTIAKRPFVWAGMARDMQVIWVKREREYFCERDWTGSIRLNRFNKFVLPINR